MTSSSIPSCIIPTAEWVADSPILRLPFVGAVSVEDLRRLISHVGFILFIASVGTLLVRPSDFAPALQDWPLYEVLIICCLLASLSRVVAQLSLDSLRANAVTCFLLLLVLAAALSQLARGSIYDARQSAAMVGKVVFLYIVVIGLVNSPTRLRITLAAVAASVLAITVVAVLQYHDWVHLQGIAHIERHAFDSATDQVTVLVRLCAIGVFNDPNDLSLVLVISVIVCGYFLNDPGLSRGTRILLLGIILFFFYALYLTHSRGGIVSALAGSLVFIGARFGRRNAAALACLLLPLLIAASWGRSDGVNLENPEDTFQTRLELWSESFDALRSAPLAGIGQERLRGQIGQVTHNSYIHAFAEMGLLGGIAFLGTFYLVLRGLWRAAPQDPELARMRPYVLAMTAAFAAGLLSLSRCYQAPTLLLIGIATAYLALVSREGPRVLPQMDRRCLRHITGVGLLFLAVTYVFLRVMLQRGAS